MSERIAIHALRPPGLDRAVRDFLQHETRHIERYRDALETLLPYKSTGAET